MSRLIDVAAVLDRMANALQGTEQGEACAFAVRLMRERESMTDETQELADALEEADRTLALIRQVSAGPLRELYAEVLAVISAALARHRAKQEVQS